MRQTMDGHRPEIAFSGWFIELEPGIRGDALSTTLAIGSASFHQTETDPKLGWHPDPARQFVITLNGTLEFDTADGRFTLRPGDNADLLRQIRAETAEALKVDNIQVPASRPAAQRA